MANSDIVDDEFKLPTEEAFIAAKKARGLTPCSIQQSLSWYRRIHKFLEEAAKENQRQAMRIKRLENQDTIKSIKIKTMEEQIATNTEDIENLAEQLFRFREDNDTLGGQLYEKDETIRQKDESIRQRDIIIGVMGVVMVFLIFLLTQK